MKKTIFFVLLFLFPFFGMASPARNNDDSCEITGTPATTLLAPDFEESQESACTLGIVPPFDSALPGCNNTGRAHTNAIGHAKIDMVDSSTARNATQAEYFTEDLLWTNVLPGDAQQAEWHSSTNVDPRHPAPERQSGSRRRREPYDSPAGALESVRSSYKDATAPAGSLMTQ